MPWGIYNFVYLIASSSYFTSVAAQGVYPVNISYKIIPSANISLLYEYLLSYND